jgi:hypothetical protein
MQDAIKDAHDLRTLREAQTKTTTRRTSRPRQFNASRPHVPLLSKK